MGLFSARKVINTMTIRAAALQSAHPPACPYVAKCCDKYTTSEGRTVREGWSSQNNQVGTNYQRLFPEYGKLAKTQFSPAIIT